MQLLDFENTDDAVVDIAKNVTAIADNTFTDVFTVAVPNATARAYIRVTFNSALGAGGAVGAGEACGTTTYDFAVVRFAGAVAVIGASSAYGAASALSSGAATITTTAQASAVTGAAGVAETFTIQVKIVKGSGSSDNHTCRAVARIIIPAGSGINIY